MTINAESAIEIAKDILSKAGHYTIIISQATKENNKWVVVATTLAGKLKVILDGNSGEVLEIISDR